MKSKKLHFNPSLGSWLELIHRNGFLLALYSEVYNSKDYSVGCFIEFEILTGSFEWNQTEREMNLNNWLKISLWSSEQIFNTEHQKELFAFIFSRDVPLDLFVRWVDLFLTFRILYVRITWMIVPSERDLFQADRFPLPPAGGLHPWITKE